MATYSGNAGAAANTGVTVYVNEKPVKLHGQKATGPADQGCSDRARGSDRAGFFLWEELAGR